MKPRKKWQPEYRFGGNPAIGWVPGILGETQCQWRTRIKKPKQKKGKK